MNALDYLIQDHREAFFNCEIETRLGLLTLLEAGDKLGESG